MIDDSLAFWYYSNLKKLLQEHTLHFNLYWWSYTKHVQVLDIEEYAKYLIDFEHNPDTTKLQKKVNELNAQVVQKDLDNTDLVEATSIFSQHIDIYLKWNIIWDDFFQLLLQLLEFTDVFQIEYQQRRHG